MSTYAEFVGKESIVAVTVCSFGVVVRVDRASHTVAIADEIVAWANLAKTAHETKTTQAYTGVSSGRVG